MKFLHILATAGCALTLAACSTTASDHTDSRFSSVDASGDFSTNLDPSKAQVSNVVAGSYSYQAGVLPDGGGFLAEVGIVPTVTISAQPVTGSTAFVGNYELGGVGNISLSGDLLFGQVFTDTGSILISVDYDDNTLAGTSDNGRLVVDGTFNGSNLDGGVTYEGISGDLDGLVGGLEAVGIFHGKDNETIYAGGFRVTD